MTERAFDQADTDRDVPQPPNVIPIGRGRPARAPHADTVALLERLLVLAKAGEIVGVLVATAYASGHTGTGFAHRRGSWELLLAALHRLRLRVDDYERRTD